MNNNDNNNNNNNNNNSNNNNNCHLIVWRFVSILVLHVFF